MLHFRLHLSYLPRLGDVKYHKFKSSSLFELTARFLKARSIDEYKSQTKSSSTAFKVPDLCKQILRHDVFNHNSTYHRRTPLRHVYKSLRPNNNHRKKPLLFSQNPFANLVQSTSPIPQLCSQPAFLNQQINGNQFCCPGSLDQDSSDGAAYCCVGNNNGLATNTATSYESDRTGTVSTCSTTVHVTESDYTSRVEAAGTKYGVSYVSPKFLGGSTTRFVEVTPTSTGGVGARRTGLAEVGVWEVVVVVGVVAMGL